MNETTADISQWYAIRTRQDFRAEKALSAVCDEVFFPKETITSPGKKPRMKAVIPHVLFIRTSHARALQLEDDGHKNPGAAIPLWIYRNPGDNDIQVIPQQSIDLLRLLTADDTTRCRIYTVRDFRIKERVRVTGGIFKGYEGFVKRIEKNRHVVVNIEGICMAILPYIHPDLLEKIENEEE